MKRSVTYPLVLAIAGVMQPVSAQVTGSAVLEEIIVTARKKEEGLMDTPVSLSVFSAEQVKELNINDVNDIAKFSPGLSFSKAFGRSTERPVIRGAANILAGTNPQAESGAAYFVDGMYYPGDILALDMTEIARVEVIKGPQSALYGRNTYSGAINFISVDPFATEGMKGGLSATAASHGEQRFNGNIGYGSDNVAFRINATTYDFDGEYTNLTTGKKAGDESTNSIGAMVALKVSEQTELKLRYTYSESEDGSRALQLLRSDANNCYPGYRSNGYRNTPATTDIRRGTPDANPNPDNMNQYFCGVVKPLPYVRLNDGLAQPGGLPAGQDADPRPAVVFSGVNRDVDWFGIQLKSEQDGFDVSVNAAYRNEERLTGSDSDHWDLRWYFPSSNRPASYATDPDDRGTSFFNFAGWDNAQDMSFELRLASNGDDALSWSLGAFLYDQDQESRGYAFENDTGDGDYNADFVDEFSVENQAVFGSIGYQFTDAVSGTLEMRYAEEDKGLIDRTTGGVIDKQATETFTSTTFRATLDWQLSDDTMLFGVLATGNKPGGLNNASAEAEGYPDFEEEESDNIEIGLKTTLWDGRANMTLSAYFNDVSKFQLTTPLSDPNGLLASAVSNQGDAEIKGVELDFRAQLTEVWNASIGASWSDPKITKGCDAMQFVLTSGGYQFGTTAADITAGWTHPDGTTTTVAEEQAKLAAGDCSIAGKQIPLTSKVQGNAVVGFDMEAGGLGWFGNVNANYESSKFAQVHNGMETGDATEIGFTLGVRGENWTVKVYGKNVTDEDAPAALTRWGDYGQGSATVLSFFPSFSCTSLAPQACNTVFGLPGISDASSGIRAPFISLRPGASYGLTAEYKF